MCKSLPKICTFLELELKNLQIFCHQTQEYGIFYSLQINSISVVLVIPLDIAVNFTDLKFTKVEKCLNS